MSDLEALTVAYPLRERGWLLLIQGLHRAGRTPEALERYRRVRDLLDEELGLEPGPALRDLHVSILRGQPDSGPVGGAPATGVGTRVVPVASARRTPLVGRDAARQILVDALSQLRTNGPRYVVIEGEAGIGKTRLAEEATDIADASGLLTVWGRCHEDPSIPALWPWRQVVAALGHRDATLAAEDLSQVFERVRDVLVRAATSVPVVVVIEDAHWADPASLRLLSFLTREIDRAAVAFLVTTRPGQLTDQHVRTRADLARTAGVRHLDVRPLDVAATAALVTATGNDVPSGELASVCERSGGNPLFAIELARLYDGRSDPTSLPGGIRDVLRRRLTPLSKAVQGMLRLAAVLGERIDLDLLLQAEGPDPVTAADTLDAPMAAGLLVADGGSLRFSHALVRETVLADLSVLERRRLHARVARAQPVDVYERAYHLVQGRPLTDAAAAQRACLEAAHRAERDRTYASAAQWWQQALEVGSALPAPELPRQRGLLGLGNALVRSGQALAGQQRLRDCLQAALDANDTSTAVDAAAALSASQGSWYWVEYGTNPTPVLALLRRTLARLDRHDGAARARLLLALAAGEHYVDTGAAASLADQAVDAARSTGDPAVLADALAGWLSCTWSGHQTQQVVAAASELLALAGGPVDEPALALHALTTPGAGSPGPGGHRCVGCRRGSRLGPGRRAAAAGIPGTADPATGDAGRARRGARRRRGAVRAGATAARDRRDAHQRTHRRDVPVPPSGRAGPRRRAAPPRHRPCSRQPPRDQAPHRRGDPPSRRPGPRAHPQPARQTSRAGTTVVELGSVDLLPSRTRCRAR